MNDRQAFSILSKTKCCIESNSDTCIIDQGCKKCPYYVNLKTDLIEAIEHVSEILKNRDPELRFVDALNSFKEDRNEHNQN